MNDFLLCSGAEIYTENLVNLLKNRGHDVYLITFDKKFKSKIENFNFEKSKIYNFKFKSKLSKVLFKKGMYKKLTSKIKEINPDKIIVNNFFSSPTTQYRALEGYEAFQIVHDNTFICPNLKVCKNNGKICRGYKFESCIKNCKHHNSKLKLMVKLHLVKKVENLRKKYIKKFIVPSLSLTKYLQEYGYDAVCINNPVSIIDTKLPEKVLNKTAKNYIYVGLIKEEKGIFRFLNVYDKFSKNHNINLKIIGKPLTIKDKLKLKSCLKNNSSIEYLGYKDHKYIDNEIKKSDFSVVPSYYLENYPTTVLEGILGGNVVIASNRGGTAEILDDGRGLIFDILDENSIYNVLEKSYNLTEDEYNNICKKAFEYVLNNNSYDTYYEKIMKIIDN